MNSLLRVGGPLALVLCGACTVDPFCLRCEDGGEPPADTGPDGCLPGSPELCNGRDDNCDGFVDEGYDFDSDPFNCGGCGGVCELAFALPSCRDGQCAIAQCLPGSVDRDGLADNGCEADCHVPSTVTGPHCDGPDCCDGADNDCDGSEGEDHDTDSDPNNCGGCNSLCDSFPCPRICAAPFAETACQDGDCVVLGCRERYFDRDGDPSNGCEVRCEPSGEEQCNGLDDDCDGEVDETFSTQGLECNPGCNAGTLECVQGRITCVTPLPTEELCDGEDNDCDSATLDGAEDPGLGQPCGEGCGPGLMVCQGGGLSCDEAQDPVGRPCGTDEGTCTAGTWRCEGGELRCQGEVRPSDEVCGDGLDNDCDGETDEDDRDLGLGDLCDEGTGTGGVGICEFGALTCVEGDVVCEGFARPATVELCNGLDDDCNGRVDDAMPLGVTCGRDNDRHGWAGWAGCRDGSDELCIGHVPPRAGELCDRFDNDDDNDVDEDAVCPEGGECDRANGMCTVVCRDVDEPLRCPEGLRCVDGRCLGNLCADVECGDCERCDPSMGRCVDLCAGLSCPEGLLCRCGRCYPPTCGVLGCPQGQYCHDGRCIEDACVSADCRDDQGCAGGECFWPCSHDQCNSVQYCLRGECVDDPCMGLPCPTGECDHDTGSCSSECVGVRCLPGQACDLKTGRCVDDPCLGVHCPGLTTCREGSCFEPPPDLPDGGPDADVDGDGSDAGPTLRVYGTGGGGCACGVATARGASSGLLPLLIPLGVWALFSRRRVGLR